MSGMDTDEYQQSVAQLSSEIINNHPAELTNLSFDEVGLVLGVLYSGHLESGGTLLNFSVISENYFPDNKMLSNIMFPVNTCIDDSNRIKTSVVIYKGNDGYYTVNFLHIALAPSERNSKALQNFHTNIMLDYVQKHLHNGTYIKEINEEGKNL